MDLNNDLEVKISKEEYRTLLTVDLGEIPPILIRTFLQSKTSHKGITIRRMEDHMTNAGISHSKEAMEIEFEMNLSTTRERTGETMENVPVLRRLKGETSHEIFRTASQEVISLTILLCANLTINLRPVSRLGKKNLLSTVTRRHLRWFASSQPMLPLMNYQTSVR